MTAVIHDSRHPRLREMTARVPMDSHFRGILLTPLPSAAIRGTPGDSACTGMTDTLTI